MSQSPISTHWYLAATKPRQESKAVEQLHNQNIQAFCPMVKVEKIVRGKKRIVEEALFARYLFIYLSTQSPLWHKVRSTRGIRDWIRFAGTVAKLPDALVKHLIDESSKPQQQAVISCFNKGQPVRILSGPFAGLKAIYDKDDGEMRSMILVDFLGRSSTLNVTNEQIVSE